MAYVRHTLECTPIECQKASPQPKHTTEKDAYGNTFENWCGDYIRRDVYNAVVSNGCLPQDPEDLIKEYVDKGHNDIDNNQRTLKPYVKSPLTIVVPPYITEIITNIGNETGTPPVLVLGLSQDRDLILFNEANNQYLELEPSTQVLPTALNT